MAAGKSVATCLDLPAYVCIQQTWPSQLLQVCSDKHVVAHRAGSKKQAGGWEKCGAPLSRPRAYHSRLSRGSHTSQATPTHSSAASSSSRPSLFPLSFFWPIFGCLRPVSHATRAAGHKLANPGVGAGVCWKATLSQCLGALHGMGRGGVRPAASEENKRIGLLFAQAVMPPAHSTACFP